MNNKVNKNIVLTQWAGSKRRLLKDYLPAFPQGDTFTDLFGGSGVVTANAPYTHKYYNELQVEWKQALENLTYFTPEVVGEYEVLVRDYHEATDPKAHYEWLLRQYVHNHTEYNQYWESASLILLVQSCFGGMWTNYNWGNGRFTTPYGKRNKNYPAEKLTKFASAMAGTTFTSLDWKDVELKGFVFADPPYRSNYSNPVDYYSKGSFAVDHDMLANKLKEHGSFAYCATDLGDGWLQDTFPKYKTVEVNISHTAKRAGADKVKEVLVVGE